MESNANPAKAQINCFAFPAGPPLHLCQEAAYYYGSVMLRLVGGLWTAVGGGARHVLLPVAQALGIAWTAIAQLLLPIWQVPHRIAEASMPCTAADSQRVVNIVGGVAITVYNYEVLHRLHG